MAKAQIDLIRWTSDLTRRDRMRLRYLKARNCIICFAKYHTYNGHIGLFLRDMFNIVVFNGG